MPPPSRSMGLLRRRRDLGRAPIPDRHDEFLSRPDTWELLADAEEHLAEGEDEHATRTQR